MQVAAPLSDEDALRLADADAGLIRSLASDAARRRDRLFGSTLTYSPKIFLPLTNLCRNRCDYCSFRRSPGHPGEHTMSPDEVTRVCRDGKDLGCTEALFCLGDTPETGFRGYRRLLASWNQASTVDYLVWAGQRALEIGLLPHTNAGILTRDQMLQLRPINASLGLMLENVSERLGARGMPHFHAPDKQPARRIAMTREAGELRIPFTSGILVGIGETRRERIETLLTIRALHREYGHIQEVIVQNFRAHPSTIMGDAPEPEFHEIVHAVAMARLILDDDVSVQVPPNLNRDHIQQLIDSGVDDFGGISPLTPDFINPRYPWPHLDGLRTLCRSLGFSLEPRLPTHDRFLERRHFVHPSLQPFVQSIRNRVGLAAVAHAEAVLS